MSTKKCQELYNAEDPIKPPIEEEGLEIAPYHILHLYIKTAVSRNIAADDSLQKRFIEFFSQNNIAVQHIYLESFALAQLSDELKAEVKKEKENQWPSKNSNIVH